MMPRPAARPVVRSMAPCAAVRAACLLSLCALAASTAPPAFAAANLRSFTGKRARSHSDPRI